MTARSSRPKLRSEKVLVSFVRSLRYLRFLLLNPNAWVFEQEVTEATEEALTIPGYP